MRSTAKIPESDNILTLRSPEVVMDLSRMGSFFPFRLSFARIMLRNLLKNKTEIKTVTWDFDDNGFGHAVYSLVMEKKPLSFIAISNSLKKSQRTDRVIASAWDTSFTLFDGIPSKADIARLKEQLPLQEAGRYNKSELVLSRANKSVRIFDLVVKSLSSGNQPSSAIIDKIGYLMRTTAVYGNGKFGISDRKNLIAHSNFNIPFQMEMLTVYLIRNFSIDLVQYIAKKKCPEKFVNLDKNIQRHLGIGNATGLGMAPFLVKHPILLNNWFQVRETALSRMLNIKEIKPAKIKKILGLIKRVESHLRSWATDDNRQAKRIEVLRQEWNQLKNDISYNFLVKKNSLSKLYNLTENKSLECQELMASLIMEIGSEELDCLDDCMESSHIPQLDPSMTLGELGQLINKNFSWVHEIDFSIKGSTARFWYVSEEKLEPRLGNRYEEDGAELERPLDIARRVSNLEKDLKKSPDDLTVAEFLMKHPGHRYVVRRIQSNEWAPYSEIHENLIDENCMPIDMLRCKLAFFGASKFDPKSDRWVRVNLFQGAPLADEISSGIEDDWWMPVLKTH